jgi:hypothetical protein
MRTLSRVFAITCLLASVMLTTVVGCGLSQRLGDIEAHLEAVDQNLDNQAQFLEHMQTQMYLELRKLRRDIGGIDKYILDETDKIKEAFKDIRERIKSLELFKFPEWVK